MASAPVQVMYVGRKPFSIDNVSGSGKTWSHRGEVQEVTHKQARQLLAHPDQWWLAGPVPTQGAVDAALKDFYAGNGIPEGAVLAKTPDEMDAEELRDYALREYGEAIPATFTAKQALAQIETLEVAAQEAGGAAAVVAKPRARPRTQKAEPVAKPLPAINVAKAGKDRLDQYAKTHLGVELDQRKKLSVLRKQVKALIAKHKA